MSSKLEPNFHPFRIGTWDASFCELMFLLVIFIIFYNVNNKIKIFNISIDA